VAVGFLRLPPSEFWQLTPMEFDALCASHLKSNPHYTEPLSRDEFDALAAQFPARVDKHGKPI